MNGKFDELDRLLDRRGKCIRMIPQRIDAPNTRIVKSIDVKIAAEIARSNQRESMAGPGQLCVTNALMRDLCATADRVKGLEAERDDLLSFLYTVCYPVICGAGSTHPGHTKTQKTIEAIKDSLRASAGGDQIAPIRKRLDLEK